MTDALRTTMGFDGFVMSDYDAWQNIVDTHHYVGTYGEAATLGITAGLDQEGGGGPTYPPVQVGIPAALAAGNITLDQLNVPARRLMRARLRLGMFDPAATNPYDAIDMSSVASPAHLALAEQAAREGMTLLKNKGGSTLPLSLQALASKTVAVLGPNANASYTLLGSYSDPKCCSAGIPSMLTEFSARAVAAGVAVTYAPGCTDPNCADTSLFAPATALAATADAVVVVFGMGNTQYACVSVLCMLRPLFW